MKELIAEDEEGFRFSSRTGLVFISNWVFIALTIAVAFGTFLVAMSNHSYKYFSIFLCFVKMLTSLLEKFLSLLLFLHDTTIQSLTEHI